MSDPAIIVENVSKRYVIGHQNANGDGLRHALENAVKAPLRWIKSAANRTPRSNASELSGTEDFWALKDISFEVKRGEAIGIIGRNGAGKSTLLKILSRITEPTTGRITLNGRVASLLEVGTGFHPELTGRENIFLNGAILGMSRLEIKSKFDEIVAFAEVERFIDTPVKRYSSGMYVRLAFAVAAHLEPEILIVDEVLAVGDSQFQKKCLGKMNQAASEEGRTVLFVSHNLSAISTLTTRALYLHKGQCQCYGPTSEVITQYLQASQQKDATYTAAPDECTPRIISFSVETSEPNSLQAVGKPMDATVVISAPQPINGAAISLQAINQFDQPVLHLWLYDSEKAYGREPGMHVLKCHIPKVRLNVGNYTWSLSFGNSRTGQHFETILNVCPFSVTVLNKIIEYGWRSDVCTYLEDYAWTVSDSTTLPPKPKPLCTT